ncbi:MAG: TolB family protein [Candidatus Nanopelagicales bacterium]|uniref:TolB family protein n=1 Tax=Pseudonocardia sp. TaxID=60912 RepID=UPI003D112484
MASFAAWVTVAGVLPLVAAVPASAAADIGYASSVTYSTAVFTSAAYQVDNTAVSGTVAGVAAGTGVDLTFRNASGITRRLVKLHPPAGVQLQAGTVLAAAPGSDISVYESTICPLGPGAGDYFGSLTVHAATYTAGVLSAVDASFEGTCDAGSFTKYAAFDVQWNTTRAAGSARYSLPPSPTIATGVSRQITATVTSNGTGPVHIGAPGSILGYQAPHWNLVGTTCTDATLDPGSTCAVTVEATADWTEVTAGVLVPFAADVPGGTLYVPFRADRAAPPSSPTFLTAIDAHDGVTLGWLYTDRYSLFHVMRSLDGGPTVEIGTAALPGFADTTVPDGATATYTVTTEYGGATGPPSAAVEHVAHYVPAQTGPQKLLAFDGPEHSFLTDGTTSPSPQIDTRFAGTLGVLAQDPATDPASVALNLRSQVEIAAGSYTLSNETAAGVYSVTVNGSTCLDGSVTVNQFVLNADRTPVAISLDLESPSCGLSAHLRYGTGDGFDALVSSGRTVAAPTTKLGATSQVSYSLTNVGTRPITPAAPTFNDWLSVPTGLSAGTDGCTGTSLSPRATCTTTLTVTPTVVGDGAARVSVSSNRTAAGVAVEVTTSAYDRPGAPMLTGSATLQRIWVKTVVDAPANNSPVTTYRVYAGQSADSLQAVADIDATTGAQQGWELRGVAPGQTRYIAMSAINAAGEGPQSTALALTVPRRQLILSHSPWNSSVWALGVRPIGDTGPVQALSTPGVSGVIDATVSPDGKTIAFSAQDGTSTGNNLYLRGVGPDAAVVQLTSSSGNEVEPDWAPGGKALVYSACTSATSCSLRKVTLDGTVTPVPGGEGLADASYLPDGSGIVAVRAASPGGVARVSPTGAITSLSGGAGAAYTSVSPDGRYVAAIVLTPGMNDKLVILSLTGGAPRTAWAPQGYLVGVTWTRDSSRVLVTRVDLSGVNEDLFSVWSVSPVAGTPLGVTPFDLIDEGWPSEQAVDDSAPVITPKVPAWTTTRPAISFTATDTTDRRADLSVKCALDGAAAVPCASGWKPGLLAAGTHNVVISTTDPAGNAARASVTFRVDAAAPAASPAAAPRTLTSSTWRLSWSGKDAGSGVASYDVAWRYSGGTWKSPSAWSATTAKSVVLPVAAAKTYCWHVRARDKAGNVGPWSAERCSRTPYDDRALSASSTWARRTGSGYLFGTLTSTSISGARATSNASVSGTRVDLVVTRCPACGSVDVYIGSTKVGRISTAGPQASRVLVTLRAGSKLSGRLVVIARGGMVNIDGYAVLPA